MKNIIFQCKFDSNWHKLKIEYEYYYEDVRV